MSKHPVIEPSFGPGSGWYVRGQCGPGSLYDRQEMRKAAIPCTVVVMRRRGLRLSARELLTRDESHDGFLVCQNDYTFPHWYASLFDDEEMRRQTLPNLLQVQARQGEHGRLYHGIQIEERVQYPQAWLCTPTPEQAREILIMMMAAQSGGAV